MVDGFIQGPADSSGKRVASAAVVLPAGTRVHNADGTGTVLSVDTLVFLQKVTLVRDDGTPFNSLVDEDSQQAILTELRRIRAGISKICGDPLLDNDDL